ncbi:hypothetical protein ACHHV8_05570 [Paenibacillus sp. TAB 01]|uniref:hypothetical protein n=1 Tax=Paenibacillus sp. TAB 01 TaxID=3368988 RepID=UPI003752EB37
MNWHQAENEVKLHLLRSLARSQRALARILESVADTAAAAQPGPRPGSDRSDPRPGQASGFSSGDNVDLLIRQLTVLSSCQQQLTEKLTGIRLRKFRRGRPGKLWLCRRVRMVTGTAGYPPEMKSSLPRG